MVDPSVLTTPVAHDEASWLAERADEAALSLLRTARERLRADTATLLLLDRSGTVLEPAAWLGLGRQARAAAPVRMGEGFAGRVALTGQPLALEHVSESNVRNPILRMQGLRSLLGVPVLTEDHQVLGVIHVGSRTPRSFDADSVATLQEVAGAVAEHLTSHAQEDSHTTALVLQRSLLPPAPPAIEGLDLGARYVPADGDLGGDWYDVFALPGGRVGLVMGDVIGHGLEAAVVMGRLRNLLRAYALEHPDPATVMRLTDQGLAHYEQEAFATILFAVISPDREVIELTCAGHPPPVLCEPTGATAVVDLPADMLLGVGSDVPRRTTRVPFPPGSSLAMYTDGLVERRFHGADAAHLDAQVAALTAALRATDDVETACSRILTDLVGAETVEDDIALLVCKRNG